MSKVEGGPSSTSSGKRAVSNKMDKLGKTKVFFDGGTPEEFNQFKRAAKALLLDVATASQEVELKRLLGNKPLGASYGSRTTNFGSAAAAWADLDARWGGKTRERARDELDNFKQRSTNIEEYIERFQLLVGEAEIDSDEAARTFRNRVNPGMRQALLTNGAVGYNNMLEVARTLAPGVEKEFQRRQGKGKFKREKANKFGQPKGEFKGECWECHEKGHRSNQCPRKGKTAREAVNKTQGASPSPKEESDSESEN